MDRLTAIWETVQRYHLLLVLPLVLAWALGPLATRWLKRLGARREAALGEALETAGSRSLRLLILLIVLGWAVTLLPLVPAIEQPLGAVIYVLAVIVGARLAMRIASVLVHFYLEHAAGPARERARRDYLPIASTLTTVVVAIVAAISIAHHFGHDVSSLVAALGIGSLAIGLAAQATLSNMVAGFTLLVDRPFRPGDRVKLQSGELGRVEEIGIRSTRILLDDLNLLIVPNAELANSRVVNFSFPSPGSRGEVKVKVPFSTDVSELMALLTASAKAEKEVVAQPAPEAAVTALSDGAAEIVLHFHVLDQSQQAAVEQRIRHAIAHRLGEAASAKVR